MSSPQLKRRIGVSVRKEDLVPGSVLLSLDSEIKQTGSSIILVPPPSEDDRDPLRWSTFRKTVHLVLIVLWIFLISAFNNWLGPPIMKIMEETNTSFNGMNVNSQ